MKKESGSPWRFCANQIIGQQFPFLGKQKYTEIKNTYFRRMTVELVLFITNEKTEEDTYTHYKFARKDIRPHIRLVLTGGGGM